MHLKILHLEDEPADAELIKSALQSEDISFDIRRVASREKYVEAVRQGGYDLIFADYSLPGFDGLTALEIAREKCPDIPFIFVTGKMGEELAIDSLKSGATDYVLKHRLSRLSPAVKRALAEVQERIKRKNAETELKKYQEHLEELVRQRTDELESVNAQLKAANKDLESFSFSASHDLRSPLITIDGFSRILQEDYGDKLDDEGKRLLSVVRENSRKMAQLIEDILSFSRVSTKGLQKSRIDMQALAKNVADDFIAVAAGGELRFSIGDIPAARGDLPMVRQVFVNLVSNALKYRRPDGIAEIEIGGREDVSGSTYFVKDNGIGFDMRSSDKLFGLFQRLHNHKEFRGTGVGLAIVKRIIEKHGGRVWAEAEVGKGATFYFSLPVQ